MNQNHLSRRKVMQLMSLTFLGSLAIPKVTYSMTNHNDFFDEEIETIHIKKGEGKVSKIGGIDIISKLSKHQTSGNLGCDEATLKPGFLGAPPHMHKNFDEICYVLEGSVTIMVEEKIFQVNAGDWHLRPRNKIHTFWNSSESPARFIDIYSRGT